jgi:hypothetical protein
MSQASDDSPPVRVFISYSRDTPAHCAWVVGFAKRLNDKGIAVILDEWDLKFGADTASFMWKSIQDADRVLVVCTDTYVAKAEDLRGGVGYETMILNAGLISNLRTDKFIPVYCPPTRAKRPPVFLGTRRVVDLSDAATDAQEFEELLADLHGISSRPPLGPSSSASDGLSAAGGEPAAAKPAAANTAQNLEPDPRQAAPLIEVYLALSSYHVLPASGSTPTSVLVVTDEWTNLAQRISQWRDTLSRDARFPAAIRQLSKNASIEQLVDNPVTRGQMLGWLSLTPFSAYLYYAQRSTLLGADDSALKERFFITPLLHRMSKKSERILYVQSDVPGFEGCVAAAIDQVKAKYHRVIEVPKTSGRGTDSLVALARLIAGAASAHLERPEDNEATATFASLRTRIRFAQDVVTGERHTRDEDPLP